MDLGSAIAALRIQVEDTEDVLEELKGNEDLEIALTIQLQQFRERLQILQDRSMAYGRFRGAREEVVDGVFGVYHASSYLQEQPGINELISTGGENTITHGFAGLGPQPEAEDSARAAFQEIEKPTDLDIHLTDHESVKSFEVLTEHQLETSEPTDAQALSLLSASSSTEEVFTEFIDQEKAILVPQLWGSDQELRNQKSDGKEILTQDPCSSEELSITTEASTLQIGTSTDISRNSDDTSAAVENPTVVDCTACREPFAEPSLIKCPCSHQYCAQCLAEQFKACVQGPQFPPVCCTREITLDLARPHLSNLLSERYLAKQNAIASPGTIYCALLHCQTLIAPENIINGRATCTCGQVTCVVCKFVAHDNACPKNTERAEILDLAVKKGLRACYSCGELYEREFGCNHMTCMKCTAQFCYNCGLKWGTCRCGQYAGNAAQLIQTGYVVDNRRTPGSMPRTESPTSCDHLFTWSKVSTGENACHRCRFNTGHFLFHCTSCRLYSCVRCRRD